MGLMKILLLRLIFHSLHKLRRIRTVQHLRFLRNTGEQTVVHISLIQQYFTAGRNFFEIPIDLIISFDGNTKVCHIISDFLGNDGRTHIPGAFFLRHGQEG